MLNLHTRWHLAVPLDVRPATWPTTKPAPRPTHRSGGRARRRRSLLRIAAVAAFVAALALAAFAPAVSAAPSRLAAAGDPLTLMVGTTADVVAPDDGVLSLREAFSDAAVATGPVTISLEAHARYVLGCGEPGTEDDNASGDLDLGTAVALTVEGHGATITTASCGDERLLDLQFPVAVTLRDLTLAGGAGRHRGGAIRISDVPTVRLERVVVTGTLTGPLSGCTMNCRADGAVALRGVAQVNVADSDIVANTARVDGCLVTCSATAGIYAEQVEVIALDRTTVGSNGASVTQSCGELCGSVGGFRATPAGSVALDRSAVTANTAAAPCANCTVGGIQVRTSNGTTITNSTIADNDAGPQSRSGGLERGGGAVRLIASTLFDNRGAGVANLYLPRLEQLEIRATVIGSTAGPSGCDAPLVATIVASTETGTDCGFPSGSGNRSAIGDPGLAPLAGRPPARPPRPGSPLIDAVAPASCATATDQAGTARPADAGCDTGAIETTGTAARFVTLTPQRLFDTRPGEPGPGPKGLVGAGQTIEVQVTGNGGVPSTGVAAVVLNLTATDAIAPGFVTAWPTGEPQPLASSLNLTAPGQTRPNLVTVPVGAGGRVSLYSQSGTHLVGDVAGYYETVNTPQQAGRIVPLAPTRVFDSRPDEPAPGPKGIVGAGATVTVPIAGRAGVPATGAAAVIVNLTATDAAAPGFVTVWPSGQEQPLASVLNLNTAGDTAPNLVMVPIGPDGAIRIATQSGAHLLADVTGYVTDASAPPATAGLFVPLSPSRLFDTRADQPAPGPKGAVPAGGTISPQIAGTAGVAGDAAAVVVNLTGTETPAAGFVTAWPSGRPQPLASTLNLVAGDTRANAAVLLLGADGRIEVFTQSGTHLLADVAGYLRR